MERDVRVLRLVETSVILSTSSFPVLRYSYCVNALLKCCTLPLHVACTISAHSGTEPISVLKSAAVRHRLGSRALRLGQVIISFIEVVKYFVQSHISLQTQENGTL